MEPGEDLGFGGGEGVVLVGGQLAGGVAVWLAHARQNGLIIYCYTVICDLSLILLHSFRNIILK